MEGVLLSGEVPGYLHSAAKVPLSKVPKPETLTQGSVMSWRLIQRCTLSIYEVRIDSSTL